MRPRMAWRGRSAVAWCVTVMVAVGLPACRGGSELERLVEARRLSSELLVQFTTGADAGNRAVMADTDQASAASVQEAAQAAQAVQRSADALRPLLSGAGYASEAALLKEFDGRFADYLALDRQILALAVENSNVKAQRLSFGPAQQQADAVRDALESVVRSVPRDSWQARALAATTVSAVRDVQAQQAPHIAEADDAVMTRLEARMAASLAEARAGLLTLVPVVDSSQRARVVAASTALDLFADTNAEIVTLSRRNSDVRSLALSLGRKRILTARCDESLRALHDALAKRGFPGTR